MLVCVSAVQQHRLHTARAAIFAMHLSRRCLYNAKIIKRHADQSPPPTRSVLAEFAAVVRNSIRFLFLSQPDPQSSSTPAIMIAFDLSELAAPFPAASYVRLFDDYSMSDYSSNQFPSPSILSDCSQQRCPLPLQPIRTYRKSAIRQPAPTDRCPFISNQFHTNYRTHRMRSHPQV